MRCELDRLGERAATGTRHHSRRIDVSRDQSIEQGNALVCRYRVRLAGRTKHDEPAVLGNQPLAMPDEAFWIRRKIGLETALQPARVRRGCVCSWFHIKHQISDNQTSLS